LKSEFEIRNLILEYGLEFTMSQELMKEIEKSNMKAEVPSFEVGDTVDVAVRIVEGEKERVQVFTGTVIMRKGRGVSETFTVRRIVNNEGVERIFALHSPFITTISVRRSGHTRRAKLYYLRDRVGKATRLGEKHRRTPAAKAPEAAPAEPGEASERELAASAT
jgi:large subunit ribosomal protein L19